MRAQGWEERMAAVIAEWRDNRYDFARASCLHFARAVIMAVRGPAADGLPPDEPLDCLGVTLDEVTMPIGAARLLARHDHDPAAIITAVLGAPVPVLTAGRGDLAAVDGVDGLSIGVVDGELIHVVCHDEGMTYRLLSDARCAWSVS